MMHIKLLPALYRRKTTVSKTYPFIWLLIILLSAASLTAGAQQITGTVVDTSGNPLPFATIKFINSKQGLVADLNGRFSFAATKEKESFEVSYLNYEPQKVEALAGKTGLNIILRPLPSQLTAVIVTSTSNKLRRILQAAVENRSQHNPDNYTWYRCHIYYKMVADILIPDSVIKKDTSKESIRFQKIMDEQHMLVNETYSTRTWQRPAKLQEDILATRMSGFKHPITSLVTNVLPFHSYNDFINLNGKDYKSPLSRGLFQHFSYRLSDELLQGSDTVWVINFAPKKLADGLQGTLFIHSSGYAISNLSAHRIDSTTRRNIGIEQQYKQVDGKWFPHQLNYHIKWQLAMLGSGTLSMKGNSEIDSLSFVPLASYKFDRAHTARLAPTAHLTEDSTWKELRPVELQPKEARTFVVMDSISKEKNFDWMIRLTEKLVENKLPAKMFDINLPRIYSYNQYEQSRFGFGMQTNEKILKWASIGGWGGYGVGDKTWKYGGFGEVYLDRYKEFMISGSYYKDLRDPGRIQLHNELDKNYLRMFLMNRVDMVEGWNASVTKKLGYLTATITGTKENIQPQYPYQFVENNTAHNRFYVKELSLTLRYAFGETTAPVFGRYYSSGSKYPVLYSRITRGIIENSNITYTQAIGAIKWEKNINRWGKENFLLLAGASFSKHQLPISKLFAGNGFLSEVRSIYVFGGMQTMRPYDYYSDRFINFYWMHNLPNALFKAKLTRAFSTAPTPAIGHNVLWGTMKNPQLHAGVEFSVPDNAYHESGLMLNQLLRLKMMGMFYMSLNAGYFYHWTPTISATNGRLVFGIGAEF
ncbi:DUF5686 family protein [Aridibaculum aurantiacum]|uniref:DUF5686 family protein n=1 Tax=Aridibaculum aurantiacum TaxID=2810307 RepID=UPI001A97215F|nr:DUF5686 family protein [Aridibaculum aurantiacum]